jgi:hypothetical protein
MSASTGAPPKRDKRRLYADFLERKAVEAPDSGLVWISAVDAEEIALLLRAQLREGEA